MATEVHDEEEAANEDTAADHDPGTEAVLAATSDSRFAQCGACLLALASGV